MAKSISAANIVRTDLIINQCVAVSRFSKPVSSFSGVIGTAQTFARTERLRVCRAVGPDFAQLNPSYESVFNSAHLRVQHAAAADAESRHEAIADQCRVARGLRRARHVVDLH